MRFLDGAADSSCRAGSCAGCAALALVCDYLVLEQILADARRTFLVNNMSYVLISEVTQSGKNGVRSSLTQTAQ